MWREAKAPNGRIYFYKKSTRETTWTKPASYIPLGGTAPVSTTPQTAATPATTAATQSSTFNMCWIALHEVFQHAIGQMCVCVSVCQCVAAVVRLPSLSPYRFSLYDSFAPLPLLSSDPFAPLLPYHCLFAPY